MSEKVYCSVDIGGTKILAALLDGSGRLLCRSRRSTPAGKGVEAVLGAVTEAVAEAAETAGISFGHLLGIGVCVAAFVEYPAGLVHRAPNINWPEPVPLLEIMRCQWPCPVFLENDTNAAVLGEVHFGAARGHRDVIYITISTGIGGGFYLGGRLYRGGSGFAGEIGHIKFFGRGRRCGCGRPDCLEAWASGEGITRSARQLLLGARTDQTVNTAWVFHQAKQGNILAREIVEGAASDIATGLANLVTLLNPTCLVVGGSVTASNPDFLVRVAAMMRELAIEPAVSVTPLQIVPALLEPEAGLWGMYSLMKGFDC